jgi:Sulfotransferase family
MAKNIILAFGMPRSGTTWCGKIFDSHPDTIYRHEPDTNFGSPELPLMNPVNQVDQHRQVIEGYIAAVCRVHTERASASLPIFPKRYYSPATYQFRKGLILAVKLLSRQWRGLTVPDLVDVDGNRDITIVWKSIESLGRLGLFANVSKCLRAVHILRHPCGQISSVLNGESGGRFSEKLLSSEDYGIFRLLADTESARIHGVTYEKFEAMEPLERLAWRWVIFNEQAILDSKDQDNCMILRYEDLCLDPESQTRKLFTFTGLDWNEQTSNFISMSTGRNSNRYYSVFKDPIKAMNKWQDILPVENVRQITAIVKDTLPGRLYFPE